MRPFFVAPAIFKVISMPMVRFRKFPAAIKTAVGIWVFAAGLSYPTGKVFASCQFSAGSTTGSVSFPVLDPVTAPNVNTAIQLNVRCTPPSDFAIAQWTWTSANGGASIGRLAGGTPPYPPGILYSVGISVVNQGPNGTLTLSLQIAGPNYANASAGSYSDVLTLMVTP